MKWCVILATLLVSCDSKPPDPSPTPDPAVVVLAASSLKELMTEFAAEWTHNTGREVKAQFEDSSTLARQIRDGAPVDIFVTASPEWLDQVKPVERYDWLSSATESHPRILYSVGLMTNRGKSLFESLRGKGALEIAARRGFVVLEK